MSICNPVSNGFQKIKGINKFIVLSIKIMKTPFTELEKIIPKCKWKHERLRSANMIWGGWGCYVVCVMIPHFELYYRAMVTETTQ